MRCRWPNRMLRNTELLFWRVNTKALIWPNWLLKNNQQGLQELFQLQKFIRLKYGCHIRLYLIYKEVSRVSISMGKQGIKLLLPHCLGRIRRWGCVVWTSWLWAGWSSGLTPGLARCRCSWGQSPSPSTRSCLLVCYPASSWQYRIYCRWWIQALDVQFVLVQFVLVQFGLVLFGLVCFGIEVLWLGWTGPLS